MKQNEIEEIEEIEGEVWTTARYIFEDGRSVVFENYKVSSMGRVKSLRSYGHDKQRLLNIFDSTTVNGEVLFYIVNLFKNRKHYTLSVHRLVLSSFKPEDWFPGAVVDHINARSETSCDNSLHNLRWFTVQQNSSTSHCTEQISKALRNRPDKSKRIRVTDLTSGEVTNYPSAMEAGRALGICATMPSSCINNYEGLYKKRQLLFEYIE